jgi:hypothetical protein
MSTQATNPPSQFNIVTPVSPSKLEELADYGYGEEYVPPIRIEPGMEALLLSFLERGIRDYMELDPTSQRKSSEYSDGWTQSDEWMTAAKFLFSGEKVMEPWDITFQEMCDILDIHTDTILAKIKGRVGNIDHRNFRESTVG